MKGKIKADSLANSGYLILYSDSAGTIDTLDAGLPGQVLISNGGAAKPYWGDHTSGTVETYFKKSTLVTVNNYCPNYTFVPGLAEVITLDDSATVNIFSIGSTQAVSISQGRALAFVQVFLDSTAIQNAAQLMAMTTTFIPTVGVDSWNIVSSVELPAGTYSFDVRACRVSGTDSFNAGGNSMSPSNGNQGSLMLQVQK